MKTLTLTALAVFATLAVACGGNSSAAPATSPTSSPESKEVASGGTLTEFQKSRLLGHYSTRDGASGFILDRTVTPPRAKLDGTDKVCPLAESHGPFDTKEYRCEDKTIWIRVDGEGNVQLFQGPKQHEGVNVVRDADAKQLK